jgi:hypothetical protein
MIVVRQQGHAQDEESAKNSFIDPFEILGEKGGPFREE